MRKYLLLCLTAVALLMSSCYKDDINDLNDKYDRLSKEQQALQAEQQRQAALLENYRSLLNAVDKKLSVSSWVKTEDGYNILFSDGTTMSVKNGAKGEAGTSGQDGKSAPAITSITQTGELLVFTFSDGSVIKLPVVGRDFTKGVFVLNEGNMSNEMGKLTYIDALGAVYDSVYLKVNGTELGNVCQDMCIAGSRIYIVSQNGGADGRLVIADAKTLAKEKGFDSELSTLSWPSHVAVTAPDKVYMRDNNGIYQFNPETGGLTFIRGSKGAARNRMIATGNKVFAFTSKSVLVIQDNSDVVETIEIGRSISGIVPSDDGNIWVSSSGTPSVIAKLSTTDYSIIAQNEITEISIGAGFGATPGISAKGDTLYFSNASTRIYRHVFTQKETRFMVDVKNWVEDAGIVYNNLAVHPVTGHVYINTIKGYGLNYLINNISVFNFNHEDHPLKANYKNHNSFPAGIFFSESYR